MKKHPHRGWVLSFSEIGIGPIAPRYQGFFEAGETAPKRIRVGGRFESGGASARFKAPLFSSRCSFGVSLEIPPEIWQPAGTRRGWHFFHHKDLLLGIWTSLPATWLAQTPGGEPLQPPWRELWTFGSDHIWSCRIIRDTDPFRGEVLDTFMNSCSADAQSRRLSCCAGKVVSLLFN